MIALLSFKTTDALEQDMAAVHTAHQNLIKAKQEH